LLGDNIFTLSKETWAQITFPQYVAIKNPSWSEEDVLHGIIVAEEKKEATVRWLEEQRNPTPIRSKQLCYSCKVPWEPDHRCRGKDKKSIIEVHYDSDDEVCEDGEIDVDLGQPMMIVTLVQRLVIVTFTEASDSFTLEEDSDPYTLEEQWDGRDDSTNVFSRHITCVDDPTPQQSGDTSEDSHVLAPRDDELPMMTMTHLSYFQTYDSHIA
jgi:hypothetical protein